MSLGSRIAGTPNNKTDASPGTMGFAQGTLPGDDKEYNAEDADDHDDGYSSRKRNHNKPGKSSGMTSEDYEDGDDIDDDNETPSKVGKSSGLTDHDYDDAEFFCSD